ncbi:MucR family transcriptional regulator [Brevundimonas sp.]|uniref:MucR family transcriptional regulator n=1 Tax=Brevundimonas sp. TaxID=1871086 RepID=UPI0028A9847A|nr:MucR family transcriptional regulator [Brevundimonas sp.]
MQNVEEQTDKAWTALEDQAWDGTIALVSALLSSSATQLSGEDLNSRIRDIFGTLLSLRQSPANLPPEGQPVRSLTWLDIQNSIGADTLISFENGRHYKNLKRHLDAHGMTPEQYREKWNLPPDYPTLHPSYSAKRSQIAKQNGFGRGQRVPKGRRAVARKDLD